MKINLVINITILFCIITILSGCSTILNGGHQDLTITTTPPGLTARIGDKTCISPCALYVSRHEKDIFLSLDGKNEKKLDLDRHYNWAPYVIGNAFTFWIPGMIVDKISGADYTINPFIFPDPRDDDQKKITFTAEN